MITTLNSINLFILIFFIFSATIYTLLLIAAVPAVLNIFRRAKYTNVDSLMNTRFMPPVTIITPIYNEAHKVTEGILSSLASDYKNLYIMLVNDGSTDNTLEEIISTFSMRKEPLIYEEKIKTAAVRGIYVSTTHPNLMLIDKEHSGVGDSLNTALNACFTPYFMTFDADSTLDKKAVSEMMYELLRTPHAIAVGGAIYIRNACRYKLGSMIESKMPYKLVPALQSNEYLRSHIFNRTGWNSFGSTMSYSGTASLISTHRALEVSGFDTENYAQDTEMIMRLHHHMHQKKQPYQIRFTPAAIVWTDVPSTLKKYTIQRDRWQRGIIRSVFNYFSMFFNPKYKIQGLFAYPTYLVLEVFAPFVEITAYITVTLAYFWGILNGTTAILYILLAFGFTSYLTLTNMLVNLVTFNQYKRLSDILWMFLLVFIEMFGFRQYYTLLKIYSSFHYLINKLRRKPL